MSTTENVRFFFKGLGVDAKTREYIEKRLSSLDNKFMEEVLQTEVEIDLDKKGKFRVEVMIKTPRNLFRAENTTESIEGSIDLTVEELQEQITHQKDKVRTIRKRGALSLKKKAVIDQAARF
ncbi:MAG: ribosome-associated translation inhibitor RaiA [Candidatus Moranbacteria bacterium]|nr:ribosome-associated translation inhibitor RaiA [Candidatus Moranbacteria bacterium]